MITIDMKAKSVGTKYTVSELKNFLEKGQYQAFIAAFNEDEDEEIFLITYYGVALLRNPQKTWSAGTFRVKQFVNLRVTIEE